MDECKPLPGGRMADIHFAGTTHRHESTAVPAAGYRLHAVPAVSFKRGGGGLALLQNLLLPFKLAWAAGAYNRSHFSST